MTSSIDYGNDLRNNTVNILKTLNLSDTDTKNLEIGIYNNVIDHARKHGIPLNLLCKSEKYLLQFVAFKLLREQELYYASTRTRIYPI